MIVVRTCYKHDVRFDLDYFTNKHMPLAARAMGPHVAKVEMMRVTGSANGSVPPYHLVMSVYFESQAKLDEAMGSPAWQQVMADVPNYYGGTPDVLLGEVVQDGR